MPFQSEKQRRYLWANEPEVAREWTDRYGALNGGIMDVGSNGNVRHDFENYASGGGNVSVPTSFQARPHSDPVNLAYVTPQEQGLLQNLKPGTPHHGPMGIPNYDSFDAAGGYSNPDTGYSASSGGGGGGWQDTSTQDRRQEQQWQATSDAIKKAEKQKKLIKYGDKGLDAYTLLNALKTGAFKYNPATHGMSMLLGMLGKRKQGIGSLQNNFEDEDDFTNDETGMTMEQLRDYFQGISKEDLGIPSLDLPGVDFEDYMQGKVATGPQPHLPGLEPINTMNNPPYMGNKFVEQLTLPGMNNMNSGYPWSMQGTGASPNSWMTS